MHMLDGVGGLCVIVMRDYVWSASHLGCIGACLCNYLPVHLPTNFLSVLFRFMLPSTYTSACIHTPLLAKAHVAVSLHLQTRPATVNSKPSTLRHGPLSIAVPSNSFRINFISGESKLGVKGRV